jgi:hypothetical protein
MEPKRFFEVALPNMVARSFMDFLENEGRISFDIKGGGQWTFVFGSEEPVQPGLDKQAELKLTFTRKAFDAFIDGTLDTLEAVQTKQVTAAGTDFDLLEAFGRILRPPTMDLGWNANTAG